MMEEKLEHNIDKYVIYWLEKEYPDCFIISNNQDEKEKFLNSLSNLKIKENQILMNKAFVAFTLYKNSIESFETLLKTSQVPEKNIKNFHKVLFYQWRTEYNVYNKEEAEEIDKLAPNFISPIVLLAKSYEEIKQELESNPLSSDEAEHFLKNLKIENVYDV